MRLLGEQSVERHSFGINLKISEPFLLSGMPGGIAPPSPARGALSIELRHIIVSVSTDTVASVPPSPHSFSSLLQKAHIKKKRKIAAVERKQRK